MCSMLLLIGSIECPIVGGSPDPNWGNTSGRSHKRVTPTTFGLMWHEERLKVAARLRQSDDYCCARRQCQPSLMIAQTPSI